MGKFSAMSHRTVNERLHRDSFTVLENFMPDLTPCDWSVFPLKFRKSDS
mgnify:CR=1 FL=1